MAKTKLVSLNIGVRLTIQENGQDKMFSFSILCPDSAKSVQDAVMEICDYLNMELNTGLVAYDTKDESELIQMVKPKKIKAQPSLSHKEFNEKIKELVP